MIRFHSVCFVSLASSLFLPSVFLVQAQVPGVFPKGWGGGPAGAYELRIDRTVKHGGTASASLKRIAGPGMPSAGTVVQAFKADDYRGKRLRLTGHLKSNEVKGWAGLWVRVDSEKDGTVAFDNMQDRPIKGTTDLKEYEIVLHVPDSSSQIHFGAVLSGEGQIWVDDFKFEVVGADVKLTAKEIQPTRQKISIPKDLPKEPSNLGFET